MTNATTLLVRSARRPGWRGIRDDLVAGSSAALLTLPGAMAFGSLAAAPFGPEHQAAGLTLGLISGVIGGFLAALFGGVRGGIAAPAGQLVVLLAGGAAVLAAHGAPPAALGILVAGAGLVQVLLAWLKLGRLVAYVPWPVVAGCALGASGLIVVSQAGHVLGAAHGTSLRALLSGGVPLHLGALLVAAATVLVPALLPRRWHLPDAVVGVVAGWATWQALDHWSPGLGGACIGGVPTLRWPNPMDGITSMSDLPSAALIGLLPVMAAAGVLGALLSLVAAAIVDSATRVRSDTGRELFAQGVANLGSGLCGGLAVALSESRTLAAWRSHGRGRLVGIVHAVTLLTAATLLLPVLGYLPAAVLAALLIMLAVRTLDPWTLEVLGRLGRAAVNGRLPARELAISAAVITGVAAVTMGAGLLWGLIAGLLVTVAQFVTTSSGSPVRRVMSGDHLHSARLRPEAAMEVLARHGSTIRVIDLHGALFFGTAGRLIHDAEPSVAGARVVILDLQRVTTIDASGARALQHLHEDCLAIGATLLLAHLDRNAPVAQLLAGLGVFDRLGSQVCSDLDAALERAEDQVLADAGATAPHADAALAGSGIASELDDAGRAALRAACSRRDLAAGTVVFCEGDAGDELYVLLAGSVSVVTGGHVRLGGFAAGTVFGEMALLDGSPRSATVAAESPAACLVLTVSAYRQLIVTHPEVARQIALNLARLLAGRLRRANAQIRALRA